jgi:restriction endonuclease S subunit
LISGEGKMAITNIVKLSELEGAKRIDAEYYQPEYVMLKEVLEKLNYDKVKNLSFFVKKGIFDISPNLYTSKGIPFIRVQNIRKGLLEETELIFISPETHQLEIKTEIRSYDLVLSKVGTIGEVSIIPSKFAKANFSQNVIGIKINKQNIFPGYLLVFLLTKYGQQQFQRIQMPQVQSKLELEPVKNVKVVRIGELERVIHENVLEIETLNEQSKSFYSQAENLLLEELGLKDFKPKYELSYTANLSEAFGAHRIDAEYFQPCYDEIIENLRLKFEIKKLGKLVYRKKVKINPDFDENYSYIEISDISTDIGEINYSERQGKELPPNARIPIDGGELIISKVRPTRGAIGIIPEGLNKNVICSSAFSVFTAQSPLKEYLYIISRSIIGRLQMERPTTGTSYPTINDKDVENIKVPILSDEIQQKIASLIQQSHKARKRAKELLEEAKRKVEEAIKNEIKK